MSCATEEHLFVSAEGRRRQSLGETICGHVKRRARYELDRAVGDVVAKIVHVHVDVFGATLVGGVL